MREGERGRERKRDRESKEGEGERENLDGKERRERKQEGEAGSKESYVALLKLSSNLCCTNLCFQDFERYNCTAWYGY